MFSTVRGAHAAMDRTADGEDLSSPSVSLTSVDEPTITTPTKTETENSKPAAQNCGDMDERVNDEIGANAAEMESSLGGVEVQRRALSGREATRPPLNLTNTWKVNLLFAVRPRVAMLWRLSGVVR